MISRVATRRHGMHEEDTLKLIRSLVVSRVAYSFPCQRLTKSEQDQVDAMLRKAYKAELKLPRGTPSKKLLSLGLRNTYAELREAQFAPHNCSGLRERIQAMTCSYASATSASFTTQLAASPIPDQLRATWSFPTPAI
ncbi:hypothetical protein MRX96_003996 [Rhipicephalus microplus]